MTYDEAKQIRATIEAEVSAHSAALASFPHDGPMGLTSDAVKASASFRAAKLAYETSNAKSRKFTAAFLKTFKKEIAADRAKRFA